MPRVALQCTMNSDTGSLSMLPVNSSFSTMGRNRETNSWLNLGAMVSSSCQKYLNRNISLCHTTLVYVFHQCYQIAYGKEVDQPILQHLLDLQRGQYLHLTIGALTALAQCCVAGGDWRPLSPALPVGWGNNQNSG